MQGFRSLNFLRVLRVLRSWTRIGWSLNSQHSQHSQLQVHNEATNAVWVNKLTTVQSQYAVFLWFRVLSLMWPPVLAFSSFSSKRWVYCSSEFTNDCVLDLCPFLHAGLMEIFELATGVLLVVVQMLASISSFCTFRLMTKHTTLNWQLAMSLMIVQALWLPVQITVEVSTLKRSTLRS